MIKRVKYGDDWSEKENEIINSTDLNDIDSILKMCKYFDIPFIFQEYEHIYRMCKKYKTSGYLKRYVNKMNLKGYQGFHYTDTMRLNLGYFGYFYEKE